MSRFFVKDFSQDKEKIFITGQDYNHIKNVLRKNVNDKIICFDTKGIEYETEIYSFEKDKIILKIIKSCQKDVESPIKITLAQSLPKGTKFEEIIQKSVELGAYEIIPFISERSIKKTDKNERWNKIAKEACEQCGRTFVPKVKPTTTFEEIISQSKDYDIKAIPWEAETKYSLKNLLKENKNISSILILIGPEGGFSQEEINEATKYGFIPITLGKRILRTQTAGPAVLSMLLYEMEL